MVILAISVLALMAIVNYLVCGKRLLYPPVVFCAVWAGTLLLVRLAGNLFFQLSDKTLLIFCFGALVFSLGSALAFFFFHRGPTPDQSHTQPSQGLINILLIVLLLSFPFALHWIINFASNFQAPTILMAIRMATLDATESGESWLVFGNIVTLSTIVAMIAFVEKPRSPKRSLLAIVLAAAFNIFTGGRAGIAALTFALISIDWLRNGRLRWKPMAVVFLSFVIMFAAMAIYIEKGDARADASLAENIRPVWEGFILYAGGGIVGFDRVVRQPNIIPHNWHIDRFFVETANKLGASFPVDDLQATQADYVSVGPQFSDNVYTMYFAYIDLGILGMIAAIAFTGFTVTIFYRKAIAGSQVAVVMYGFFFGALLLSPFNEGFYMGLNFSTKIFAVSWIVYHFHDANKFLTGFLNQLASKYPKVQGDLTASEE